MLPPESVKFPFDLMSPPPEMFAATPESVRAPAAVKAPDPTSSVPPDSVEVPVRFNAPAPTLRVPAGWLRVPVTFKVPAPIASVVLVPTVRFATENVPFTLIVAGLASASETLVVEVGTPSGLQLAAAPQLLVARPPSQGVAMPAVP